MASIARYGKRGNRLRILFVGHDGKRRTLRLGKVSVHQAKIVKVKVQALLDGRLVGRLDPDTEQWLAELPDRMHDRLVAVGIVAKRSGAADMPLGRLCDEYLADRTDVKSNTASVYGQAARNLKSHFGTDKPICDITPNDAEQWRRYLVKEALAEATIRKRCGVAKQIFTTAVKRKLIGENPFACLKSAAVANRAREYFVSQEDAEKLLEACPDSQWRLIIALARFGGLRCPSEILALKLTDIDWQRSRLLVHASKTERYEGKDARWVPLFPELRPYVQTAFDEAEPGAEYLVTRYRLNRCNLRTQLLRIIQRAGLKPWPRVFQNMRASRETELTHEYPLHVVTAWIGNSQLVAHKHYLQVTETDFEKAAGAAQKAAQQAEENTERSVANETGNSRIPANHGTRRQAAAVPAFPPGALHKPLRRPNLRK